MGFDDDRKRDAQLAPADADTHDDPAIVCARCAHVITTPTVRCQRGDPPAHAHTFVNPNGFVFDVACYATAPGASAAGAIQSAFSWFPGFTWQIVACARCGAHLGWHFAIDAAGADNFYGLIATAIR